MLTLIVRCPSWAPTKVWSLPIAFRLYRNRQGLTKGRQKTEGRKHVKFPDRPWYKKKSEPSFGDALTTLRRLSCRDPFRGHLPNTGRLKTQVARLIEFVSLAG